MWPLRVVGMALGMAALALAGAMGAHPVAAGGLAELLVVNQAAGREAMDIQVRSPQGDLAWAGGLAAGAVSPARKLAAGRVEVAATLPGQWGRTLRHQWQLEAGHAYCAVAQILDNRPRLVLLDALDSEEVAGWPAECGRLLGLSWVNVQPVHVVRRDLARALAVERRDIEVVKVTAREWPNSGLGCTPSGINVLQVITPGYEVVLRAGQTEAVYHTDDGRLGGAIGYVRCR